MAMLDTLFVDMVRSPGRSGWRKKRQKDMKLLEAL